LSFGGADPLVDDDGIFVVRESGSDGSGDAAGAPGAPRTSAGGLA
jgi:hypothetical protein